jgi:dynein heavy chain
VVAKLQVEMQDLQPQLAEQSEKTEKFLVQLAEDRQVASKVEAVVEEEASLVNVQQTEIKAITDEAQAELAKAIPALKEAEEALLKLNKNDITEIKGFASPPPAVVMVLEAVCILLGEKSDWDSAKKVMMEMNFL